jgi:hypothetical protein
MCGSMQENTSTKTPWTFFRPFNEEQPPLIEEEADWVPIWNAISNHYVMNVYEAGLVS